MLILPIKKKWFDMIVSGEKKEEYREIKPYYESRFKKMFGISGQILFRNGYSKNSPEVVCKCTLRRGEGKPEGAARPGKAYYVLQIQKIKRE